MIYLYRWAENQVFLKTLFFSNTDIRRFLRIYSVIECLQVNRMYVTSFWSHSKLVLEKAKKPASYQRAIHTVFFLNISHKLFKRVFWIFQMNILTDFISPSLCSNKGVLYLRSFVSSKTSLLTSISENVSPRFWL